MAWLAGFCRKSVVDIVCYDGTYTMGLLALGAASVYGVDAAESATEVARKKAEGLSGISFEKMDIYSLTAPTGKRYDVGIVRGILHHL